MISSHDRKQHPRIGEVYMMNFQGSGNAQQGWRPGLVFQNNVGNRFSPNIIALPLTSALKKLEQPTHVVIRAVESGLKQDSMVLCENPVIISKNQIGSFVTTLNNDQMKNVTIGYLLATSAIAYLDVNSLLHTWKGAFEINKPDLNQLNVERIVFHN